MSIRHHEIDCRHSQESNWTATEDPGIRFDDSRMHERLSKKERGIKLYQSATNLHQFLKALVTAESNIIALV